MRKILTFILVLCSVVGFAQMRGGALYDPGAMRTGNTALAATGTAAAPAYSFGSDPDTGIYSPGVEIIAASLGTGERIRLNSAGVGIDTTAPSATRGPLTVKMPADQNGAGIVIRGANSGGSGSQPALTFERADGSVNYVIRSDQGTGFLAVEDAAGIAAMIATGTRNILIATSTDDGTNKLQVNGFTKLGEAATGIKMKVLTGTTAAVEGGSTSIAHGVDANKIVSFTCTVVNTVPEGVAMDSTPAIVGAGFLFNCYFNSTNFLVVLSATDSENVLEKDIKIVMFYVE